MNYKQIGLQTFVIALLFIGFYFILQQTETKSKHAYVLTQEMFNAFDGTKELKTKLDALDAKHTAVLDSLLIDIKVLENKVIAGNEEALERLNYSKTHYNRVSEELASSYDQETQQFNEILWKQINEYVQEYGKENNYAFIYGASGTGTLMYADSLKDVTDDLIKYINHRYAGN